MSIEMNVVMEHKTIKTTIRLEGGVITASRIFDGHLYSISQTISDETTLEEFSIRVNVLRELDSDMFKMMSL